MIPGQCAALRISLQRRCVSRQNPLSRAAGTLLVGSRHTIFTTNPLAWAFPTSVLEICTRREKMGPPVGLKIWSEQVLAADWADVRLKVGQL